MLISREQNISDAHELFKALGETNTTLNVFFGDAEAVERTTERMPSNNPAIPSTMKLHQMVTLDPGERVSIRALDVNLFQVHQHTALQLLQKVSKCCATEGDKSRRETRGAQAAMHNQI